jgi:hypothetical protein
MSDLPPSMSLEEYRRLVRSLPPLTRAQRDAFPLRVEQAHSWYKRLPILGSGKSFLFFLDPAAGCDCVQQDDGSWEAVTREESGLHYSAIPTRKYRERFGYLAFANGQSLRSGSLAGGRLRVQTGFGAVLIAENGALRSVPEEIQAGAVRLTGMINPLANQRLGWERIAMAEPVSGLWPEESGGAAAFEQIQRRSRELIEDESEIARDPVFADLVEPERQRQRRLMLGAIDRLLGLLDLSFAP